MLRSWLIMCILGLLALPVQARAEDAEQTAIQQVISSQLDAMNKGDMAGAFAFASPMIQSMFGDADTFMTMVQAGYPQVFRSTSRTFLKLDTIEGQRVQRVLIDSRAGSVVARYEMVEIDGRWRINGCSIEPRGDA